MNRIPFGKENRIIQLEIGCQGCGARIGELHSPGCAHEECPACSRPLITCRCLAIHPRDLNLITATLHAEVAAIEDPRDLQSAFPPTSLTSGEYRSLPPLGRAAMATVHQFEWIRKRVENINSRMVSTDGAGNLVLTDKERQDSLVLTDSESDFIGAVELRQALSPSGFWC